MSDLAKVLTEMLARKNLKLTTAESCTGGLLGAEITRIAGASSVYERGFITYSNEAKSEMLGVPMDLIDDKGAVSAEIAESMVKGAIENSHADIALSITGIAGPGGGSDEKPVGTVYFGRMIKDQEPTHFKHNFSGDRQAVQRKSADEALRILIAILEKL